MLFLLGQRAADHFRARGRARLLHFHLGQAGQQPHAAQVALSEALRLERTLDVKRLAEAAGDVFVSLELLKPALRGFDLYSSFRHPRPLLGVTLLGRAEKLTCRATALAEVIARQRTRGQQVIRVEHVAVEKGANAVIGNVAVGGKCG
jgi:hypothetical protein